MEYQAWCGALGVIAGSLHAEAQSPGEWFHQGKAWDSQCQGEKCLALPQPWSEGHPRPCWSNLVEALGTILLEEKPAVGLFKMGVSVPGGAPIAKMGNADCSLGVQSLCCSLW